MASIEFEATVCSVCGSAHSNTWLTGLKDRLRSREETFTLVRCTDCGHIYLNPRPTKATLAECYPSDYEPYHPERSGMSAHLKDWVLRREVAECRRHVRPPARVLEIGCAHGRFLTLLADVGVSGDGVELNADAARLATQQGLAVFHGDLLDARFPDASFDIVYLKHVIEHLIDVPATLAEIHRILKPGGWILIATPNVDCPLVAWFGADTWDLDVPRHLNLYSPDSLRRQLVRHGLVVRSVRHDPVPNSWLHSLRLRLQAHPRIQCFFQMENAVALLLLAPVSLSLALLHRSSRIRVWAQRTG
jgi:SAM-dependent methyltransferase